MSYARWSEGSIYLIGHEGFTCYCCTMEDEETIYHELFKEDVTFRKDFRCDTHTQVLAHVEEHTKRGDLVPDRCLDRIKSELAAGDNTPAEAHARWKREFECSKKMT